MDRLGLSATNRAVAAALATGLLFGGCGGYWSGVRSAPGNVELIEHQRIGYLQGYEHAVRRQPASRILFPDDATYKRVMPKAFPVQTSARKN